MSLPRQEPPPDGTEPIHVAVPDYVYPLIPRFLDNRRHDLATLRAAVARQDYETIRSLGHRMKGDGGSYGLPRVSDIGQRLERAAAQGDDTGIRAALDELADFVSRVQVSREPPSQSPRR